MYLEFPDMLGAVETVNDRYRNFVDDSLYANVEKKTDDLLGGGDDDYVSHLRKWGDFHLGSRRTRPCEPCAALVPSLPLPLLFSALPPFLSLSLAVADKSIVRCPPSALRCCC